MPTIPDPIPVDFPCIKCGYNLRTLHQNALCPECATPVAQSIEFGRPTQPPFRLTLNDTIGLLMVATSFLVPVTFQFLQYFPLDLPLWHVQKIASISAICLAIFLIGRRQSPAHQRALLVGAIAFALMEAVIQSVLVYIGGIDSPTLLSPGHYSALACMFFPLGFLALTTEFMFFIFTLDFMQRAAHERRRPRFIILIWACPGLYLATIVIFLLYNLAIPLLDRLMPTWHVSDTDTVPKTFQEVLILSHLLFWLIAAAMAWRYRTPPVGHSNPQPAANPEATRHGPIS